MVSTKLSRVVILLLYIVFPQSPAQVKFGTKNLSLFNPFRINFSLLWDLKENSTLGLHFKYFFINLSNHSIWYLASGLHLFITLNLKGYGDGVCHKNFTNKGDASPERQSKIMVIFLDPIKPLSNSSDLWETMSLYHGFEVFEETLR